MNSMLKKYLPYAAIIFVIYIFVPFIFYIPALNRFSAVAYYFIFLVTQVVLSAIYCSKHGLDFLFALIAPIIFIPSMLIHNGGFARIENILLVVIYLVAGIFGLFLGDLAFGEERRKREKKEQLAAEISHASLYVHPSYVENSPNSVCEAQLLGVPVVATSVGGVSSLIDDGRTGFLVRSGSAEEIAERIVAMYRNRELLRSVGRNARAEALKRHDREKIASSLLEVYRQLV